MRHCDTCRCPVAVVEAMEGSAIERMPLPILQQLSSLLTTGLQQMEGKRLSGDVRFRLVVVGEFNE